MNNKQTMVVGNIKILFKNKWFVINSILMCVVLFDKFVFSFIDVMVVLPLILVYFVGYFLRGKFKFSGRDFLPYLLMIVTPVFVLHADIAAAADGKVDGRTVELLGLNGKPIANHSLCVDHEIVVFSCKTKRAKTVSLCAAPDFKRGVGVLKYRYGKNAQSIEMEYPKGNQQAVDSFKEFYEQPELGYTQAMSFHVASYRYSIFVTESHDYSLAGLVVDRGGSIVSFSQCALDSVEMTNIIAQFQFGEMGVPTTEDDISYASVAAIVMDGVRGVNSITIGEGH